MRLPSCITNALLAIHVALILVMAWLCVAFLAPGANLTLPSLVEFAKLGTLHQWSVCFGVAGAIGLVGLFAPWRWLQMLCMFLLSTSHISVAYCFFAANPLGEWYYTGTGPYVIFAALGYYILIRTFVA